MINTCFKAELIEEKVWAIAGPADDLMYLVEGAEKSLLIDTGIGVGDLNGFLKSITHLPVSIVNTHAHPDHGGGNSNFNEIYMNFKDREILKKMCATEVRKKDILAMHKGDLLDDFIPTKPYTIYPIRQGKIFDLGERQLEVIETPGHTPGSICLIDSKARIIFTGDTALGCPWLHLDHSDPLDTYLNSLYNLKKLDSKYKFILPGHFPTPLDKEYLYELIDCVKNILSGNYTREPVENFGGQGVICKNGRVSVIFRSNNLF